MPSNSQFGNNAAPDSADILVQQRETPNVDRRRELEDPDHVNPPLPVIDRSGMSVTSTVSMSDESHHTLTLSLASGSAPKKRQRYSMPLGIKLPNTARLLS